MKSLLAKIGHFLVDIRWAIFTGMIMGTFIVGIINLQKANNTLNQLQGSSQRRADAIKALEADNQHQTKIIQCFAILFTQTNRAALHIADFDNCTLASTPVAGTPPKPTTGESSTNSQSTPSVVTPTVQSPPSSPPPPPSKSTMQKISQSIGGIINSIKRSL